jgi:hypothetical protein
LKKANWRRKKQNKTTKPFCLGVFLLSIPSALCWVVSITGAPLQMQGLLENCQDLKILKASEPEGFGSSRPLGGQRA